MTQPPLEQVLAVTCPLCESAPGLPCTRWAYKVPRDRINPHIQRVHAAREATKS